MKKFRVLSDLHLDVNDVFPLEQFDPSVFTVICGDTSGDPTKTIKWIKQHIQCGVGVSGNHLPYNKKEKPIQNLRNQLSRAFGKNKSFTYLDCETNCFSKEVDGILFIGTCMYTDMSVKHEIWNPAGDIELNMMCSEFNMNDYRWGIKSADYFLGKDNDPTIKRISAKDYFEWFKNAYAKIEKLLNENEVCENPKPVVLITHHPLILDFFDHNGYVDNSHSMYCQHDFNWASYASDMKKWLIRHTSIKCYCCGHIHDVYKEFRHFDIKREDGSKILVVNNARGYVRKCHDYDFNVNLFVNIDDWTVEETQLSDEEKE